MCFLAIYCNSFQIDMHRMVTKVQTCLLYLACLPWLFRHYSRFLTIYRSHLGCCAAQSPIQYPLEASAAHYSYTSQRTLTLIQNGLTPLGLQVGKGKIVRVSGIKEQGRTASVLLRGSNKLVLEEAERSLHDALCVVRCLVHKRYLIPGGAAPEVELNVQLSRWAKSLVVSPRLELSVTT